MFENSSGVFPNLFGKDLGIDPELLYSSPSFNFTGIVREMFGNYSGIIRECSGLVRAYS